MIVLKKEEIEKLILLLKSGQTAVFPTESSYGLGCDATNRNAVEKIFKIKDREQNKPLLVVVPDIKMAKKYLVWNELLEKLACKYWLASLELRRSGPKQSEGGPGPLTVIGQYRRRWLGKNLALGVVSQQKTVAVRVTVYLFLKEITMGLGRPLVATSANLAGAGEIYSAEEIKKIFSDRPNAPDILVDGGELPHVKPTTLVSVVNNKVEILRQGELKVNDKR